MDIATYFTPGHEDELRSLYAYPENLSQPWMRVNFVSSIDGCVSVDGVSGGLGTPADKSVFGILRELCDVVVVGAGTARAENYGGVQISDAARARRTAGGLAPVPPILVVSAHASIDPGSRLLRDTEVPPMLVVGRDADSASISALRSAGAQVEVTDSPNVTSGDIDRALSVRKLRRVLCEGGPSLFGQLIEDNAVDELCITTSPQLVGSKVGRISLSPNAMPTAMRPAHILGDSDGTILTRWVRQQPRR
ncbi:pyrimidine reductase family protein [Rhodococcus sp. NPDC056516]|uniref:pyrimidine reductase family protein n=1 Tax=Rhodococcus sp. NPDC056516 TaxID=3345847 RepID=UPI00366E4E7D